MSVSLLAMSKEEFDDWLYRNQEHLRTYQAWEVARLALACGFQMQDIAPDVSTWVTVSHRKLMLWSNPLMEQWVELWRYERGKAWDSI